MESRRGLLLIAPQFSANVLEFTPVDERVASLRLWAEEWVLTVVWTYAPKGHSGYPHSLRSMEKVLEGAQFRLPIQNAPICLCIIGSPRSGTW